MGWWEWRGGEGSVEWAWLHPDTRNEEGEGERGDDDEDGRMWDMREEEGEKGFQLGWLEEEEEEWRSRDNLGGIEATAADGYEKRRKEERMLWRRREQEKKGLLTGMRASLTKGLLPSPFSLSRQ